MKKIILIVSILFATLNVNAFNNEFNLGIFVPECIYCGHINQYRWIEEYGLQGEYKSTDNLIAEDNRTFENLKIEKEQLEKIISAFQLRQKRKYSNTECDPELIMQHKFMELLIKSNNIHIKNTFFDNISLCPR